MQLYTSASSSRVVGNIPDSHFVKVFSALPSHSVSTITTPQSLRYRFQSREQVKTSRSQVRTVQGMDAPVTTTDRRAGASSLRRNQLLVLHFSRLFLLTASLRRRRMPMYIVLFTAATPVNYTNEFRELLEAITYR